MSDPTSALINFRINDRHCDTTKKITNRENDQTNSTVGIKMKHHDENISDTNIGEKKTIIIKIIKRDCITTTISGSGNKIVSYNDVNIARPANNKKIVCHNIARPANNKKMARHESINKIILGNNKTEIRNEDNKAAISPNLNKMLDGDNISKSLKLFINKEISDHCCYIIQSTVCQKIYIGYTINFARRLRQHNGEIAGGAKKTKSFRPWKPVCVISGFCESSSALRFEYRLQHPVIKNKQNILSSTINNLNYVICNGDGKYPDKLHWPFLNIYWFTDNYHVAHVLVNNIKLFNN